VSTTERDGAAEALRRHYVNGRLTLDELNDRLRIALKARRGWELRRALWGLPPLWRDGDELRRLAREARRRVVVAVIGMLWVVASLVLLLSFGVSAVTDGPSTGNVIGYPVAWLVVTALAWQARRRA
jgi:hypothetical protein